MAQIANRFQQLHTMRIQFPVGETSKSIDKMKSLFSEIKEVVGSVQEEFYKVQNPMQQLAAGASSKPILGILGSGVKPHGDAGVCQQSATEDRKGKAPIRL